MRYTQGQLEEFLEGAWSYENREGWGTEGLAAEFIGTVQRWGRLYDVYIDTEGNCWYKVRILAGRHIVSEYEAIFGRPERERRRRREGQRAWKRTSRQQ